MEKVELNQLSLRKVNIEGNILGKFGTFEIEQIYKNDTQNVLEVEYTFPITETATVVGFEIKIGDKILKGKCKNNEDAQKEYTENMVKGNSAYMASQKADDVFKISIGKIDINEEIKLKIKYTDKFEIVDNHINVLIPTLVTPRYKSEVTQNLTYGKTTYTADLKLNIDSRINVRRIKCVSHYIDVINDENKISVESSDFNLSKDFKLSIELKNEPLSNAMISKTSDGKEVLYLSFMPEILDTYEDSEKEYLFLIDVSGSMMGNKLEETKRAVIECLRQLDEGDKFNIIAFETQFEVMNIKSIEYNEENLNKAIEYIYGLRATGGTEIFNPIKFALTEKEHEKIILLFTDGQVGNENNIIRYVEENINRSRIFPFGIDSNVNKAFIKKLAKVGNGKPELIQPNEKIDDKIIRTFSRIQTPLLQDIKIDYGNNKIIDEIREDKSLFNYEYFNVFTEIEELNDDIILKGKILNKEYEWKINKQDVFNSLVDLEVIFAKEKIERLEDYIRNTIDKERREIYKKMIIELSEKYNINSKYTSFITIYERDNKIFEAPVHQNITLSDKFIYDQLYPGINIQGGMQSMATCRRGRPRMDMQNNVGDLDIPQFLRKTKTKGIVIETNIDKNSELKEQVDKYYKTFILNDNKEILTYLLYAIYSIYKKNIEFNYNDLLKFLENNKDKILSNELYMKLLYLFYKKIEKRDIIEKEKIFNLLSKEYRDVIDITFKMKINLKILSEKEIEDIINNNKIKENINDVLWYLCDKRFW